MSEPPMAETNWAGCYTYTAGRVHRPTSLQEAQQIVAGTPRIRALGSRHSFNDLPDSPGDLITLAHLPTEVQIDSDARVVQVGAGVRYGELAGELHRHGWALKAMASLPHIAVGGAIGTATHGSGDGVGCLASDVVGLEIIDARGELLTIDADDPRLPGAAVHLGALGVLTRVRLCIEPTYEVAQYVVNDVPWEYVLDHFDQITGSAYSVSMFTRWDKDVVDQIWLKSRTGQVGLPVGTPATGPQHPIRNVDPETATLQGGVAGPWQDRLPHFRMGFTPSAGAEIQAEYLMPRQFVAEAVEKLRALAPRIAPITQVCELRTIAADDLWLSMAHERETVAVHFTFDRDPQQVREVLRLVERALTPCHARPHWGKWFTYDGAHVASLYPRMDDFRRLVHSFDPEGKFHNDFLQRTVLAR